MKPHGLSIDVWHFAILIVVIGPPYTWGLIRHFDKRYLRQSRAEKPESHPW